MKEDLLQFVRKHRLILPGERVLVAFSGGADSTCLLHLLKDTNFDVAAAHLHHSQRDEGDADLEHCRSVCESLDIAFYAGRSDVPGVAKAHKMSIEEAGRKLRYEFLQMVATEGYQKIATGHTLDDNLESMLLHLTRGAGMRGLCGIPVMRGEIVRPILFVSRDQTHAYCKANGLSFITDSFNEDEAFARNKVRKHVVSTLKEINSAAAEHAYVAAQVLTEENELLDSLAASHLRANELVPGHALAFIECTVRARWSGMRDLPTALLRRCVRQAAAMYGGRLEFSHTQAIAEAVHAGRKASYTAEGGEVAVTVFDGGWAVSRHEPVETFRELLTIDGELIADDLGWSLAAWRGSAGEAEALLGVLDSGKLRGELYVRSLKPGDKIDPLGRSSGKMLTERLARSGVPQAVRARLPIVCDMVGPAWAPILGADRRCAPSEDTSEYISLRLSELPTP